MNDFDIINRLNELNNEQSRKFIEFCIDRVIDLYKKVDEKIDLSIVDVDIQKGNAFNELNKIAQTAKNLNETDKSQLKSLINKCDPFILDVEEIFDNDVENEICMLVAQGVDYYLRFLKNQDMKFVEYSSSNLIEIINQLKSEEFCVANDFEVDDEELDEYLEPKFQEEYQIQIVAIELIVNNNIKEINNLIQKTTLVWF